MAGNSNFGGYDASGIAANAAFAIEKSLSKSWTLAYKAIHPILNLIRDTPNWNKDGVVQGKQMIVPIVISAATTAPAGVTDANELSAMTYNRTAGFTQAQYEYTHIRGNYTLTESEIKLLAGPTGTARGNILTGKAAQLTQDFKDVLANMLSGSSADARDNVMGVLYPMSTSATVGNISQSSNAAWRANVSSSVGALSLPVIDNVYDTCCNKGMPTVMICSSPPSGVNSYGRLRSLIAPALRLNDPEFTAKYGLTNMTYNEMHAVRDQRMATGYIALIDPKTWFFSGDTNPVRHHQQPIPATDAYECVYTLWAGLAVDNPGANGVLSGITG